MNKQVCSILHIVDKSMIDTKNYVECGNYNCDTRGFVAPRTST